ncbi:MAG: hypothetical protein IJ016_02615 [Elusimicrobiaceae bacterium]|nr:hypothetical protein [Elusimicrobiaceae bacterium]
MNTKKIILTTLCVLAVTVAAQHAYAQGSPSVDAKMFGAMLGPTYSTPSKKSQPASTTANKPAEQPATEQAEQPASNNARIADEICECIGDACKCAWEGIKNFFTEAAKNIPAGFVPGREGAIMRSGEILLQKNKKTAAQNAAKADSLDAALQRASAAAALEHAASQK